jgi:4,5-dihydroxyphthalate decarboxylase
MPTTKAKIALSLVPSSLTTPLLDGTVKIDGVAVVPHAAKSVDDNSRAMLSGGFDVAEMSLATFARAKDRGAKLIGLPVFPGRRFVQPGVAVGKGRKFASPRAFAGKTVALPQYWLTSSMWHRGLLQHEYGVAPNQVNWVTVVAERGESAFPDGVNVTVREGAKIPELLDAGEVDAALLPRPIPGNCIFRNASQAQREYVLATGIFPIMHFIVMREEAAELAPALMRAFERAKSRAAAPEPPIQGMSVEEGTRAIGRDPWPYGLAKNRAVLDTFLGYAHEQGLVRMRQSVDALFVNV